MADADNQVASNSGPFSVVDMRADTLVRIALLGLGLGAIAWALSLALDKFVIGPVFCPPNTAHTCAGSSGTIAGNVVLILAGIGGMTGLIRLGAYRPMLVAIAVAITLWNIGGWLGNVVWYEALGWSSLMYMAAYAAFSWLVRPRNFIVVLVLLVILIVAIRYISTL